MKEKALKELRYSEKGQVLRAFLPEALDSMAYGHNGINKFCRLEDFTGKKELTQIPGVRMMKVVTCKAIKRDWNRRTTMRMWKKMTALVLAATVAVGTPLVACAAPNAWIDGTHQQSDNYVRDYYLALCCDRFPCDGSGGVSTCYADEFSRYGDWGEYQPVCRCGEPCLYCKQQRVWAARKIGNRYGKMGCRSRVGTQFYNESFPI